MKSDAREKDHASYCFDLLDEALSNLGMSEASERAKAKEFSVSCFFAKEEMLHRSGEVAKNVYFICSGLVRFYYITEDGKEYNKSFSQENQFAGAIQYTFQPEPGRFYIQALEPTRALAISLQGLNRLYQHSLPWANLGRLQMEALAVKKTAREAGFLLDSAEQRYRSFLEEEPGLARRLPLYQIASFLGITDVALSRIRRRIK